MMIIVMKKEDKTTINKYKVLEKNKYDEYVRQDVINRIFELAKIKKLYSIMLGLFCSLSCSREFCHYMYDEFILNIMFNPDLYSLEKHNSNFTTIESNNPFLDSNYLEIIHHAMFYGFYLMYKEECIIKIRQIQVIDIFLI